MKKAIYPGSFDPVTSGHVDIIERAAKMFDEVIVVIMKNEAKRCLFSEEERLDMLNHVCAKFGNVRCVWGNGLSVKYAKKEGACAMIRGIRAVQDYEYELQNATANMFLEPSIETCFLLSKPEYSFVSSSCVKEIASYHENVDQMVEPYVAQKLKEKFENQ